MHDANVRVGICSWTDKSLIASGFYPKGASTPAARLAYCGSTFGALEIDSTFYALADSSWAFRWSACTPKSFSFGMKAFALFTFHRAKWRSLPQWLRRELGGEPRDGAVVREDLTSEQRKKLFDEFAAPARTLRDAGKLGYILFQFPPSLSYSKRALTYIKRIRETAGKLPLAVEMRNGSWLEGAAREELISTLQDENIAYVAVDEPELPWTVGRDWPITAEWGSVVRFHGRNKEAWSERGASVQRRFDYEYSKEELAEWRDAYQKNEHVGTTYMMFNNCVGDKAARSALTMIDLLEIRANFGRQNELI